MTDTGTAAGRSPAVPRRRAFLAAFTGTGLAGTLFPGVLWARWQEEGDESPITAEMISDDLRASLGKEFFLE